MLTVWRIRRKEDQMFSTGGAYPSFHKYGKYWDTIHGVKRHLSLVKKCSRGKSVCYEGCEVVEFRLEDAYVMAINNFELGEKEDASKS
jgi:hypothetical protein